MQNLLSSLHVRTRLFLLILMVAIGIVAVTSASLFSMRSAMMNERQAKIVGIVESATNVVAHFHQLQQEGKLTEEQAKKEATNVLRHAKFEKTNYVFIYDTDFIRVMLPPAPDTEGKNFKDLKDTNGKYLLQDMVTIALGKGNGFTSYWFPRPDQKEAAPKLGYVQYFPQWKWVIGTGVYVDDVDTAFWSVAWTNIGIGIFLLVCVGSFSMLISQGILRQLGGEPAYALQVVHQVAEGDLTARTQLRPDDHDSLLAQMQAMIGHLGSLIRQVRDSSEAIDTAAKEIA